MPFKVKCATFFLIINSYKNLTKGIFSILKPLLFEHICSIKGFTLTRNGEVFGIQYATFFCIFLCIDNVDNYDIQRRLHNVLF